MDNQDAPLAPKELIAEAVGKGVGIVQTRDGSAVEIQLIDERVVSNYKVTGVIHSHGDYERETWTLNGQYSTVDGDTYDRDLIAVKTVIDQTDDVHTRTIAIGKQFANRMGRLFYSSEMLNHAALGLASETGKVLDALKKTEVRSTYVLGTLKGRNDFAAELADVQMYLWQIADIVECDIDHAVAEKLKKVERRLAEGDGTSGADKTNG